MQITVLGIGNILLRDDGFGVKVIEYLNQAFQFPGNVQLIDGGTLGFALLRYLAGTQKLIIVDVVCSECGIPGKWYVFSINELEMYLKQKVSMHEIGIVEVLQSLRLLGQPIEEIMVIGVEPAEIALGLHLTEQVAGEVVPVAERIVAQLGEWGITVTAKVCDRF